MSDEPGPKIEPNRRVAGPRSGVGIWLDQHLYSFVSSLGRALRRPWSTALTIGVMAVALALPLGLWLALGNVQHFAGSVQASRQVDVFLKRDTSPERARALAEEVRARPDVARVDLRTPEQGLADFRRLSGLDAAIDALDENPLPAQLVVIPGGDDAALAEALGQLPEADVVQHDAVWRQRLDGWLHFGTRLVWVLAALFGLGAALVVGNTVRLDIQSRREEIGVLQLLGASDGFIRRPFIYLGAWYGLGAGLLALGLVLVAGAALRAPLEALAHSYGSSFALDGLDPVRAGLVLVAALIIGWLGAWWVTGHYLRQTRPTDT
ncbi:MULTISPECIES: permease-like cell division protein FtsX [Pseudoxanthomonas]|jgi:cell division transport system permease protein|uniref:Cell division protein FtsX n=1 Tax=Pseudoxanthomonas winnipegensis TaxID=2480810 RepID=A0A4Q8LA68_9GAMM|nr:MULTISPECIES: permease-like cell division protein FtsX [Pseudoxanthomonas]PZP61315.1 MAG: cell division protein FtsX [Pseudoxanthomonas spadix]TAA25521.1 ABC transporter permease [Pseudoxanthomonas winnipegensis]TMN16968.1 ABC transporter permease [Pseudoxanthomonas sp. X-1]UAY74986.1 permease-like cell division protein FtsX [Pseudoxanthomonas sp. X-1]